MLSTLPFAHAHAHPTTQAFPPLGHFRFLTYTNTSSLTGKHLSRFVGGIPYALPPTGIHRWRRPRPLPPGHVYGTRERPAECTRGTRVCPQGQGQEHVHGVNDDNNVDDVVDVFSTVMDEDCLQLNIWMPALEDKGEGDGEEKVFESGWPVMFNIPKQYVNSHVHHTIPDGGFLQMGSPNSGNLSAFLSETDCKCIVVMPAYRLNLFGFLSSEELMGDSSSASSTSSTDSYGANFGFWDQRLALEWTYKNIKFFGGDPNNITLAGYSAGSHSAFHQLAFDISGHGGRPLVRRCIMWSNGPGLQPKSMKEVQLQYDELISCLNLPSNLSNTERLRELRSMRPEKLLAAVSGMKYHQFRATSDNKFVSSSLFESIDNGTFAQRMRRHGIKLLIGECADERFVYGTWHPPSNTLHSLFERLQADYPRAACEALMAHYYPSGRLPPDCRDWIEAFGRIYADIQIHMMERGFVNQLASHGLEDDMIYRYRVEWRAKYLDKYVPPAWGVTHGTDLGIWFFGEGEQLTSPEKRIVKEGFLNLLAGFLKGEKIHWGTGNGSANIRNMRRLRHDGSVDIWRDELWTKALAVWTVLRKAGSAIEGAEAGVRSDVSKL